MIPRDENGQFLPSLACCHFLPKYLHIRSLQILTLLPSHMDSLWSGGSTRLPASILMPPLEVINLWNEWWMSCSKVYILVGAPRHWPFDPTTHPQSHPTPPQPHTHRSNKHCPCSNKHKGFFFLKGDVRHIHHTGFAVKEACGIERPVLSLVPVLSTWPVDW